MKLHVISLAYREDGQVNFQAVGETEEACIARLQELIQEWRDSLFSEEEIESGDGIPCTFAVDGAWIGAEPSEPELPLEPAASPEDQRIGEVEEQLNRWLQCNMDAYVATYWVHTL